MGINQKSPAHTSTFLSNQSRFLMQNAQKVDVNTWWVIVT